MLYCSSNKQLCYILITTSNKKSLLSFRCRRNFFFFSHERLLLLCYVSKSMKLGILTIPVLFHVSHMWQGMCLKQTKAHMAFNTSPFYYFLLFLWDTPNRRDNPTSYPHITPLIADKQPLSWDIHSSFTHTVIPTFQYVWFALNQLVNTMMSLN
jgi:hypothetical protein